MIVIAKHPMQINCRRQLWFLRNLRIHLSKFLCGFSSVLEQRSRLFKFMGDLNPDVKEMEKDIFDSSNIFKTRPRCWELRFRFYRAKPKAEVRDEIVKVIDKMLVAKVWTSKVFIRGEVNFTSQNRFFASSIAPLSSL